MDLGPWRFGSSVWKRPVAFVYSGGGSRGAMQVGASLAALEAGLQPDILAGTSVGALNAAFLAAGFDRSRVYELIRIWRSLAASDVFRSPWWARLWSLLRYRDRLLSDEPLDRILDFLPFERFEEAVIPLVVVATALEDGTEARFASGQVRSALKASCAVPGLFPPVEIEGRWYVDGAVTANTPIGAATELGAGSCLVFDLWSPVECGPRGRAVFHVVLQAIQIMGRQRTLFELSCPPAGLQVYHLPLVCDEPIALDDLSHTDELIRVGYDLASASLERLCSS